MSQTNRNAAGRASSSRRKFGSTAGSESLPGGETSSITETEVDIPPKESQQPRPTDFKSRCRSFVKKFFTSLGGGETKQQLDPRLYGTPVEEVDPFVFEDTFCVISKKYGKHYVYRFSATDSLYIFGPLNPLRKTAAKIISNQLFDLFIIFVILCNCVTLAMVTNFEDGKTGGMLKDPYYEIVESIELLYLGIYSMEMILKVIAKGFILNKFSYLRNSWNILDFLVVTSAYATIILNYTFQTEDASSTLDIDFLRTFRVLRAIKTISILPGLRMMIDALLSSVVQLLEVMALTLFCLMIFALLALELFMGKLRQKCVLIKNGTAHIALVLANASGRTRSELKPIEDPLEWDEWIHDTRNWQMRVYSYPAAEYAPCANDTWGRPCQDGYVCMPNMGENYDDGWTSFDTFQSSMLSTFQLITLDFWERLYDLILSTTNPWSVLFFLIVIFLGSFYLLNLMLAVVAMSYEEEVQQSTLVPLTKHQKLSLHRSSSTFSFDDPKKLNVTVMTFYRKRTASEREMIARTLRNSSVAKRKPRRAIRRKAAQPSQTHLTANFGGGGGRSGTTTGQGTPQIKSATASLCDDSNSGVVTLSGDGTTTNVFLQPGDDAEYQVSPTGHMTTTTYVTGTGNKTKPSDVKFTLECAVPQVRIAKISGKRSSGGGIKVSSCTILNELDDVYFEPGEYPPLCSPPHSGATSESGEKKRSSLHEAILKLLGRKMSDGRVRLSITDGSELTQHEVPQNPPCTPSSPLPSTACLFPSTTVVSQYHQPRPGGLQSPCVIPATPRLSLTPQDDYFSSHHPLPLSPVIDRPPTLKERFLLQLSKFLMPVVNNWSFEILITATIIANTILLASEHHNQPEWLDRVLILGNHFFTTIFLLEAAIKICALQRAYFSGRWNLFDLFIVLLSLVDAFMDSYNIKLNVIRGMRLLRVFKLAQSWITMKVLLNIIFSTFGALGNLTLVLVIVLYIFAVLGLQVVGRYYIHRAFADEDEENAIPRWNFQNFWYAFMMVFRVLCGEWIEPLWECLQATSEKNHEYKCFFIFLPILVVGNFIVLNLFLALLLNSFDTEELNAQREKELEASGKTDNLKKIVGMLLTKKSNNNNSTSTTPAILPPVAAAAASIEADETGSSLSAFGALDDLDDPLERREVVFQQGRARFAQAIRKVIILNRKKIAEAAIAAAELKLAADARNKLLLRPELQPTSRRNSPFGLGHADSTSGIMVDELTAETGPAGTIMPCMPLRCWHLNCFCCNFLRKREWRRWDRARALAVKVVSHPFFEWVILAFIFASSITLCFEDVHLEEKKDLQEILFVLNTAFTVIFVIEMLLKWFALGLWKYFTTSWTILDFFIVAVSLITLEVEVSQRIGPADAVVSAVGSNKWAALKALRTLRALRPLRAISRWQGMKIVVNALMFAIPSIFNVLLVCLLFWLIFSIMGVQFFKGKFYKCVSNVNGEILSSERVKTRDECCNNTAEWSWINTQPNFDNVLQGYLTLFQVATFEGWMEAMRAAVDSTEVDRQPERDHSLFYYSYFVIFIVFGSFFTLNLFIGVIIDNFNRLKKKYEGNLLEMFLTPSQRHYYTAMKKLGRKKPRKVIKRPSNSFLSLFYDIAMSRRFEIAIFVMIFLNMVIMAFEHHNQRQIFVHILSGFNSFFTTIYGLEAIVKIIGLRQYYFTVPWNLFDFILVMASCVDLAVGDLAYGFPIPPTMLRIVRVFRIGRVLRLIKAAKGIRKLLFALIVSLPALFNIGALLALITFIYAILGMALFGRVAKNAAVDELFNFDTFLRSCLMLLRIMTAAGWNDVLDAMTNVAPVCGVYRKVKCGLPGEPECANVGVAIAYMVSYLIISYLIVINMYIAIILENFVEANREEEIGIVEDDLEMFYVRWSRYDPQATQFIGFEQLSEFLSSLDPPLCIPKPNTVAIVAFNLPIARGNKIHCLDILHSLVKHVLGHIDDSEEFRKLQEQMEGKFRKQFPTRKLLDIISSTRVWKVQYNAAVTIQRGWRDYFARKHPPLEKAKSTQTLNSGPGSKDHHGVLNKVGNLLHLGHHGQGRRRPSIFDTAKSKFDLGESRKSDVSISESSLGYVFPNSQQLTPVDTQQAAASHQQSTESIVHQPSSSTSSMHSSTLPAPPVVHHRLVFRGHRRSLSPSRLSGGSFDVAVTYGNQIVSINNRPVVLHHPQQQQRQGASITSNNSVNSPSPTPTTSSRRGGDDDDDSVSTITDVTEYLR